MHNLEYLPINRVPYRVSLRNLTVVFLLEIYESVFYDREILVPSNTRCPFYDLRSLS